MACSRLQRCPNCPGDTNVVPPSGPVEVGGIFGIGEQPGKDENKGLKPFIGRAGRELNEHLLPLAGLDRSTFYLTNTVKCMHASSGKLPPEQVIQSCREFHLRREIHELQPRIIVTMGALAYRNVEGWDVDLERQHGIPFYGTVFGHKALIVPMWHPALAMHKPEMIKELREDFNVLRKVLLGTYRHKQTACRTEVYHVRSEVELKRSLTETKPLSSDTESVPTDHGWRPWCITYTQETGRGYLIRASDANLVRGFNKFVRNLKEHIIFHNAPHDIEVYRQLGIELNLHYLFDTMQEAWHRGLDQSLKTLAYRHLALKMRDFNDVVRPYSTERLLNYLGDAALIDWPKPEPESVRQDDGTYKTKKPQGLNTKIKRLFTDLGKKIDDNGDLDEEFDPFKRVEKWGDTRPSDIANLVAKLGPVPRMSIEHVPFEEALEYACTDARATLEMYHLLRGRLKGYTRA